MIILNKLIINKLEYGWCILRIESSRLDPTYRRINMEFMLNAYNGLLNQFQRNESG